MTTLDFSAFNDAVLDPSIKINGPGASVAMDLEPEYIAVSSNSKFAYVTIQEANAVAIVQIESPAIVGLVGLGFKDHMLPGNGWMHQIRQTISTLLTGRLKGSLCLMQ